MDGYVLRAAVEIRGARPYRRGADGRRESQTDRRIVAASSRVRPLLVAHGLAATSSGPEIRPAIPMPSAPRSPQPSRWFDGGAFDWKAFYDAALEPPENWIFQDLLATLVALDRPITLHDRLFVPAAHLGWRIAQRFHPRSCTLDLDFYARCSVTAFNALVREAPNAIRVLPPAPVFREFLEWRADYQELIGPTLGAAAGQRSNRTRGPILRGLHRFLDERYSSFLPRDGAVNAAWRRALTGRLARDDSTAFGGNESDRRRTVEDEIPGVSHSFPGEQLIECIFVGRDGRLHLGATDVRDALAHELVGRQARGEQANSPGGDPPVEELAAVGLRQPSEEAEESEALDAIRAFRESFTGAAYLAALEYLESERKLRQEDVAERHGVSRKQLRTAMARIEEEGQRRLRKFGGAT